MSREETRYCDVCELQLTTNHWQENSQRISFNTENHYDIEIKLVRYFEDGSELPFDICLQCLVLKVTEISITLMEHRQKIKEGARKK